MRIADRDSTGLRNTAREEMKHRAFHRQSSADRARDRRGRRLSRLASRRAPSHPIRISHLRSHPRASHDDTIAPSSARAHRSTSHARLSRLYARAPCPCGFSVARMLAVVVIRLGRARAPPPTRPFVGRVPASAARSASVEVVVCVIIGVVVRSIDRSSRVDARRLVSRASATDRRRGGASARPMPCVYPTRPSSTMYAFTNTTYVPFVRMLHETVYRGILFFD